MAQMDVVVATNNKHKLEEIRYIFEKMNISVLSLSDINLDIDVEETGRTFEENALLKARAVAEITGKLVVADDSGLEVKSLNYAPGINSARYSGFVGEQQDFKNREKLLEEMKSVSDNKREARFCTVIAAIFPDGKELLAKGIVTGKIVYEEKGNFGFGYDSLFIVDGYSKTMAELPTDLKNKISHRANALRDLEKKLKDYLDV